MNKKSSEKISIVEEAVDEEKNKIKKKREGTADEKKLGKYGKKKRTAQQVLSAYTHTRKNKKIVKKCSTK